MKRRLIAIMTAPALAAALGSCNYLEVEPVGVVIPHKTTEYRALLTEGYRAYPYYDGRSLTGLLSDELGSLDPGGFFGDDGVPLGFNLTWQYGSRMKEYEYLSYYKGIFQANAVIDGVMQADHDSSESREQILGEAYALRAYAHFELANLYGKWYDPATAATDRAVPLATRIDVEQNFIPATVAEVYAQVLSDITRAGELMDVEVQPGKELRYRFSRKALRALESRVRLYMRDWQGAYDLAAGLLPSCPLQILAGFTPGSDDPKLPWKEGSEESILSLDRPFSNGNGDLIDAGLIGETILAKFDPDNDLRWGWLRKLSGSTPRYRAIRGRNDRVSIRSAEIWLNAAEAALRLGREDEARGYLETLHANRYKASALASLSARIAAMNADELLTEILDERARELLLEGHRWFDLRRTTRPSITKTYQGETHTLRAGDSRYTLPFPRSAVEGNPDLEKR